MPHLDFVTLTIPPEYYETNGNQGVFEGVIGIRDLLNKWNSIINDETIPPQDRLFFKQIFLGYMEELEERDGTGPSMGEGWDDLLRGLEFNDPKRLGRFMNDTQDLKELAYAFAEAYRQAKETSGVEIGNESDRLSGMILRNDWKGVDDYAAAEKERKDKESTNPSE